MTAEPPEATERTELAERIHVAEKGITWIRVGVIVFNTVAYLTLLDSKHTVPWLAWTIIFVANPYAFWVVLFEPYRRWPVLASSVFTSVSDGVLIALWVIATGGVHSEFHIIWYLSIVAVAFRFGYRATLLTSFFYSACYLGILLPFGEVAGHETEVAIRIVYIFLTGGIAALMGAEVYGQAHAKLEAQRRMAEAEAANLAKSEFLANMSHEIRTPLNGVIGMTDILLDTSLTPEQRAYAETAQSAADTLLTLINDVLDLSRLESNQMTIEDTSFDLESLLDRTLDLFEPRAAQKGIELVLRRAPEVPRRVRGDPGRLRQILTNLVGNAVKFTDRGSVKVDVSAVAATGDEVRLRVRIEDTGIGIPFHQLEHVFQRFTQADGSTTRRYGGTGLGLAITRQLVELLGGRIGVESRVGTGSTFWFEVPVHPDPGPAAHPEPPPDVRGLRLLVGEAHPLLRRTLVERLAPACGLVHAEETAAETLRALREAKQANQPFDVAILGASIPDTGAEPLAREIKRDPGIDATVLLLLAAPGHRGDARRMADCGFAAYLTRPIDESMLLEAIATAWSARTDPVSPLVTRHSLEETSVPPATLPRRLAGRILLAEDNPVNQRVARLLLEKLGLDVDTVENGRVAVERTLAGGYDLVLMDCQMPELDGYAATAEIRRGEDGGHRTPIVAMTANAMQGDRERCLAAGMDDYVPKPVRRDTLQRVLARWLDAGRPAASPPTAPATLHDRLEDLRRDGGDAFASGLVGEFREGGRASLAGLEEAARARDAAALARLAHDLKGSSATVGADELAARCAELERRARTGPVEDAGALVAAIERAFHAVEAGLDRWQNGLRRGDVA